MCGVRAACCPIFPSNFPIFIITLTLFRHRLTPSRASIRCVEKALPPSGAPPKVVAPNSGNRQTSILKFWRDQGERQHSPFLPGDHGSPGDLDSLRLTCAVVDVDVEEVEPSGVDAHKRGGALLLVGATPALAEGTAGVEPAGEAEKAVAAKPEALVPRAQDKAGVKSRCPHEKGRESSMPCHRRASARSKQRRRKASLTAKSRHRRKRARARNAPRRCYHRATANAARHRKENTRANALRRCHGASGMCHHEGTRMWVPWPVGIQGGSKSSSRKGLLR